MSIIHHLYLNFQFKSLYPKTSVNVINDRSLKSKCYVFCPFVVWLRTFFNFFMQKFEFRIVISYPVSPYCKNLYVLVSSEWWVYWKRLLFRCCFRSPTWSRSISTFCLYVLYGYFTRYYSHFEYQLWFITNFYTVTLNYLNNSSISILSSPCFIF